MLRQQSIDNRRANGFVLIVLENISKLESILAFIRNILSPADFLEATESFKICVYFANLEARPHSFKCLAAVYAPGSFPLVPSCRCGCRCR